MLAMCADEQVTKVSRVDPASVETDNYSRRKSVRRLQDTVSEAGNAHGVSTVPLAREPSLGNFI